MEGLIEFLTTLPLTAKIVLGFLVFGILFSILKKFVKFAILIAILIILFLVIMKLMAF